MKPVNYRLVGNNEFLINWLDGHRSLYGVRALRCLCPCAQCVDELTGKRILDSDKIPADLSFQKVETIGLYALRFLWSDGHSTGIYSFDWLRAACPCSKCSQSPVKN